MLNYLDKFVNISDDSSTPESIVQKNSILKITFKNLKGICLNGFMMDFETNNIGITELTIRIKSKSKDITNCDMEFFVYKLKNFKDGGTSVDHYEFYVSAKSMTLHYVNSIDWLDISTDEGYADKYQLQYNTMGMCILNNAADLKWFLKDYPDTKPYFLINKYGQICLSYIYDLDKCLDNIYKSCDLYREDISDVSKKLGDAEVAYVTLISALVPVGNNIGKILEAYSYIVMAYHIRYDPIIFNSNKYTIGCSTLEETFERITKLRNDRKDLI